MSTKPNILVTSAAGKTGLHVVLQLRKKGFPVRAFIRKRDHRSDLLAQAGAEIFEGNQYAITEMRRAMAGMQRAYQCAPTAPNGLHFSAVFTAAAHEARLEHVVTLGQWLTAADHPSLFTREVYLADHLAELSPHTSVTKVNPGWFADNYLMGLGLAAQLGLFAMPLGAGDQAKNAAPANEDIARVVVAALTDPTRHAGKSYRPTGPKLTSPNEIAQTMGRVLGHRVRYMDVSQNMMVKALRAWPPANYSEAAVSQLAIYAEEYRRGTFAINAPTEDVEAVTGQKPKSLEEIIAQAVAAQPEMRRKWVRRTSGLAAFAKVLLTPRLNLQQVQQDRDYVTLSAPRFSQDCAEWRAHHHPSTPTH